MDNSMKRKAAPEDTAYKQLKNEASELIYMAGILKGMKSGASKPAQAIMHMLSKPPAGIPADLSFPCFAFAKELKKSPAEIAKEIAAKISEIAKKAESSKNSKNSKAKKSLIAKVEAAGPYVNFSADWQALCEILLCEIEASGEYGYRYGYKKPDKKALVEHTSINPNASPHVGRSRNAIIGDSIVRILKYSGYDVETHYLVNDIGKQIALLVLGCGKKDIDSLKFEGMLEIYRNANAELEKNPEIEKDVFALLSKLERGDAETIALFKKVSGICVSGQREILKSLNIDYDYFDYESGYVLENKLPAVLKALEKTGAVITDEQGRKVLKIENSGLPEENRHMVIARSDGTSMYTLRDIAYTVDKIKRAGDLNVVVLGEDHKLHFQQLAAVMRLLGYEPPKVVHYSFILLPTGKMSTRKGDVVLLEDFLKEAADAALSEIESRNPELPAKEKLDRAKKIAVAAVRYGIVKVSPEKNIIFSMKEAIRFEGDTGPYLQYTYARANSILKKEGVSGGIGESSGAYVSCAPEAGKAEAPGNLGKSGASKLKEPEEIAVLRLLAQFPEAVESSAVTLQPHILASYMHELSDAFNSFYQKVPVLKAETGEIKNARLALVLASMRVLSAGLSLLGIDALEEM